MLRVRRWGRSSRRPPPEPKPGGWPRRSTTRLATTSRSSRSPVTATCSARPARTTTTRRWSSSRTIRTTRMSSSARNCSCSTTTAATCRRSSAPTTCRRCYRPTRRPTPATSLALQASRSPSCARSMTIWRRPASLHSPTSPGNSCQPGRLRPGCATRATRRITGAPPARSGRR